MKTESNWRRGTRYYWVHKSSLALSFIGSTAIVGPRLSVLLERPKEKPEDYHRCEIVVVRTKKEAAELDRKIAKRRRDNWSRFAALMAKSAKR